MQALRIAMGALALVSLAGTARAQETGDLQNGPLSFPDGGRGWIATIGQGVLGSPSFTAGRVFAGAGFSSNWFVAITPDGGDLMWGTRVGDNGPTAALIENDTVIFGTESCTIFAFDVRTGRQRWRRWLGDPLMSQPAVGGGRVFSSHGGTGPNFEFAALRLGNGRVQWHRAIDGDVLEAPVVARDNGVYFTTTNGVVYRFDQARGRQRWSAHINATSVPWVAGDAVYVAQSFGAGQERTVVLAARDGQVLRAFEPSPLIGVARPQAASRQAWEFTGARPVVIGERLYQAIGRDVLARDAQSGELVWRWTFAGDATSRPATPPAVVGGQVVFGAIDGHLRGLSADDGAVVWDRPIGSPITHPPIVANGWVYATTNAGQVVGVELGDPELDGWYAWGGGPGHIL